MRITINTALHKVIDLVGTTIQQLRLLTKPQFKFFMWLIRSWWKQCYHDEEITAYEVVVYSVSLKRKVKAVYVVIEKEKGYELLISTDVTLTGDKVLQYYHLRFHIEFLIQKAKQCPRVGRRILCPFQFGKLISAARSPRLLI